MQNEAESDAKSLISNFPYSYQVTAKAIDITSNYSKYEGKKVSLAGRAVGVRKAGKLLFIDLLDSTGKIQAYFEFTQLGEDVFNKAKAFNSGDIIGIEGEVFKTTPGQISVKVAKYVQLAKSLRVLPDKWHGMSDVELRYRKRHLDLIMNPEVRKIFVTRSKTIRLIQEFLDSRGFMEFETPIIQPLYGGADAEPFKTFVNTVHEEHYLRISDELYLKRLIIGGFDKVYEFCHDFRNEDTDTTHHPEFTMIEWYQAYADYNDMMKLTEEMFEFLAKRLLDSTDVPYQGKKLSFKGPFKRIKYIDGINEKLGVDVMKLSDEELFALAEKQGIKFIKGKRTRAHAYDKLMEECVQKHIIQPTFVIDFPRETSPLTRPKRGNPALVERFELYVDGVEINNAYSELTNPFIQKENFDAEAKKAALGDKEAEPTDTSFIEAMEQGMPPTGGLGMGIDRLVMLLTDKPSIKEVILFPIEKRGQK